MKARVTIIVLSCLLVAAATTEAQVVVRGTESSDQTASSSRVNITTRDREIVPLLKETKKTQENDSTQRSESVTRVRLNDGGYFDWQQNTTVKKEVAPGVVTEISSDVVEKDRQGGDRTAQRTVETVVKTDGGEKSQASVYTRNSSGQLVLDHVVDAATVKNATGQANTTRIEQVADVNGNLVLKRQSEEVATEQGPNATVTTARTRSVNHLSGQLDVTEESTTSTRTDGNTKQIDTVVRKPGRTGWEVTARTSTTETTAPDGSVSRETIEQGRSLYSTHTGNQMLEPLVPQRKVIERETHQSDGAVVVERDAFRRDVNGDWKPETFSTNEPSNQPGQRPAAVVRPAPPAAPEGPPARPRMEPH